MAESSTIGSFNPDIAMAAFEQDLAERKQRAAQHLLAGLRARIPVERPTGKKRERRPGNDMLASATVVMTETGFDLVVGKFYAWWVERGHKVGTRRSGRAKLLREYAKTLRKERKLTGDESLKEREDAFRKEATREMRKHKASGAAGKFVEGRHFVQRTLDEERDAVIAILSGG